MLKRSFDFSAALFGLLVLAPVFLTVSVVIYIDDGAPVLFRQMRIGLKGAPFQILKFRTMRVHSVGSAVTIAGDDRVTTVGQYLRRTKLDELPQLINVLLGHMSFVGPRPEVPRLFESYPSDLKKIIASMRPGITDFASLEFSNESEMLQGVENPEDYYLSHILPMKSKMIRKYFEEQSFRTDLRLILHTVRRIVFGH